MKRNFLILLLVLTSTVFAAEKSKTSSLSKITATEVKYNDSNQTTTYTGNVQMTEGSRKFTANEAVKDEKNSEITFKGSCTLQDGKNVIKGEEIRFNSKTQELKVIKAEAKTESCASCCKPPKS
jgi:lipopolysaccharide export system protein LptA